MNHGQRKHALLSASGAHRWMTCTPSARLEDKEEDRSSVFAEEGTLAHEFAEAYLKREIGEMTKAAYNKRVKELEAHELYSPEMDDYVALYTTYVLSQYKEKGGVLLVEQKINLTHYIEEGFGSNDAVIIADGEMEVDDLKYGQGLKVNADNNDQLMLYGLGALRKYSLAYNIKTVRLTIIQPRLDHISTWVISADDLRAWGENEVKPKATLAYEGKGELVAGDHCRFCKVKHKCRALKAKADELAKLDFCDPKILSDDEIIEVYNQADLILDWLKAVGNYVFTEANTNGKKWKGYKLVAGKSNRVWSDPEAIAKILLKEGKKEEEIYNTKLKGIGDIEKLVGKKNFNPLLGAYVVKPQGKPTLVPESDKRPALGLDSAKNDFS